MDERTPQDRAAGREPDGTDEHRMPTWVKVSVIAGGVLVVLLVVAMVFGGAEHGPGRHLPGGGNGEVEAPGGHEPPIDRDHG